MSASPELPLRAAEAPRKAAISEEIAKPAAEKADQYVREKTIQLRFQSATKAYNDRADLISVARTDPAIGEAISTLDGVDAETAKAVTGLFEEHSRLAVEQLHRLTTESDDAQDHILDKSEWPAVRRSLNEQRMLLDEVAGGSRIAAQVASLWSLENRWFWLFGLIAASGLMVSLVHARRHEVRQVFNGGAARALRASKITLGVVIVLLLATLSAFFMGDRIYAMLIKVGDPDNRSVVEELQDEIDAITKELPELQTAHDDAKARFDDALAKRLRQIGDAKSPLHQQWKEFQENAVKLNASLALRRALAAERQKDADQLAEQAKLVNGRHAEIAAYNKRQMLIRFGFGATLSAVPIVGGVFLLSSLKKRRKLAWNTCPQCLAVGKFEPLGHTVGRAGSEMVRCTNVVTEQPYIECNFEFAASYREMTKLCFPTLGVPTSGKTHWLLMAYRELNLGHFPRGVHFSRIATEAAKKLQQDIDDLLQARLGPQATQTDTIPHPLVFNFRDSDRYGTSNVLVNIFDYSGEVTQRLTIDHPIRQRAFEGDGFFFFIDPTAPSEPQAEALANFREDIHQVKGIKVGKQLRTPIALVVPKIDLMLSTEYGNFDENGPVGDFYRQLGEIGWGLDLKSIEARSNLIKDMREIIWPGWQIERQIHDLFGGRYMYFPLTPVGLDNLEETDLSRRKIAPVGVIDPVMWLLHMNGYPVLK